MAEGNKGSENAEGKTASDPKFPIVGIGASAGGLEALSEFLGAPPSDTGLGFVVIAHLSPNQESLLAPILDKGSKIPVIEVQDEPKVLPNHVYVIPPDRSMTITDGHLQLLPRRKGKSLHHPIDTFFASLAADRGHKSIGVVLSGSGTDGTIGLSEIKLEGGLTFAQDFTAKFESMPRSAINANCVDFVLAPVEIARELVEISQHPYVAPSDETANEQDANESSLSKVMQILHHTMGVDFTYYKKNTLYRRVTRRMVLHKLESMVEYAKLLRGNQQEIEALFQDILINVTSFFRNPEAFDALKTKVFPNGRVGFC